MPSTVDDVARFLESFAPPALAAAWDNVGLLIGDRTRPATRIMTCLTVTPPVVDEALAERVELIVSHHPLPFHALRRLTTDDYEQRLVWRLASAGVSLYSPHTAFDSCADGINRRLADRLGLVDVEPLEVLAVAEDPEIGVGRRGRLMRPLSLGEFADGVKSRLGAGAVDVVGDDERLVEWVAAACGSAGDRLEDAIRAGCDCFVTGEAKFHTAVAAAGSGIAMVLVGHYASERFGVEHLAEVLKAEFLDAAVWASRCESDPLRRV